MRSRSWSDENIDIYERRWRLEQTSNFKRPESVAENREKHSPEILTGIGIAGMTAAAVMAVKATPKARGWWTKRKSGTESA